MLVAMEGRRSFLADVVLSGFENLSRELGQTLQSCYFKYTSFRVDIIQPKLEKFSGITSPSHPPPPFYRSGHILDVPFADACRFKTHLLRGDFCLEPLFDPKSSFLIQSLHINGEASAPSYHLNSSSPSLLIEAADGDKIASTLHAGRQRSSNKKILKLPFSADIWAVLVTICENYN